MAPDFWRDDDPELVALLRPIERLRERRRKHRVNRILGLIHKRAQRRKGRHDCATWAAMMRDLMRDVLEKVKQLP